MPKGQSPKGQSTGGKKTGRKSVETAAPRKEHGGKQPLSTPPRSGGPRNGQAAGPREAPAGRAGGKDAPLVLIVDDYEDAREMCAELLQFYGYRTAVAANGQEAIEKALDLLPAIILMDLSLPGMDGWEATRRLKADQRTRRIPIVAVTGHAMAGHSDGARDAGCDSFLAKPVLPDDLVAEVRRLLDLAKNN